MKDLLPEIRIASPCLANWDDMEGDERARFCRQCRKHVYNLSALTADSAAALIREKEGRLCGAIFRRADGTVLHADDCPAGLAARQWRRFKNWIGAGASLVLLMLGIGRVQGGEKTGDAQPQPSLPREGRLMGEICLPTPTPSATPQPTPVPPAERPILGAVHVVPTPTPTPDPKESLQLREPTHRKNNSAP